MPKYNFDLKQSENIPSEEVIRAEMKKLHYTQAAIDGLIIAIEKVNTIIAFGKQKAGNDKYYNALNNDQQTGIFRTNSLLQSGLVYNVRKADAVDYEKDVNQLNQYLDEVLNQRELKKFAKTYVKPVKAMEEPKEDVKVEEKAKEEPKEDIKAGDEIIEEDADELFERTFVNLNNVAEKKKHDVNENEYEFEEEIEEEVVDDNIINLNIIEDAQKKAEEEKKIQAANEEEKKIQDAKARGAVILNPPNVDDGVERKAVIIEPPKNKEYKLEYDKDGHLIIQPPNPDLFKDEEKKSEDNDNNINNDNIINANVDNKNLNRRLMADIFSDSFDSEDNNNLTIDENGDFVIDNVGLNSAGVDNNISEDEVDRIKATEADLDENLSMYDYIERIQRNGFKNKDVKNLNDNEKQKYIDDILKIMAARYVAHAERGNKNHKLESSHTDVADVIGTVIDFRNDNTFATFIGELKENPKMLKQAMEAATSGHGGKMDEMFKKFVLNMDPGYMENTQILGRYMPTIRERIDVLKKKIEQRKAAEKEIKSIEKKMDEIRDDEDRDDEKFEKLGERKGDLEEIVEDNADNLIVSEILTLRNMANAHRGKKASLDKPVPVSKNESLSDIVKGYLGTDKVLRNLIKKDDKVVELALTGHGGDMVAYLREKMLNNKNTSKPFKAALEMNTISHQMDNMCKKAGELTEKIKEADEEDKKDLVDDGKALIQKYMILASHVWNKNLDNSEAKLYEKDTPWLELAAVDNGNFDKGFKEFFKDFKSADYIQALEIINKHQEPKRVKTALSEYKVTVVDARKVNAPNRPGAYKANPQRQAGMGGKIN